MLPVRNLFAIILLISSFGNLMSQGEFGIVAGISNYQGDIPSVSTANGFKALIGPVIGLHAGLEKSSAFQLRADLQYLKLSGDDILADNEEGVARNLDFYTSLLQLAAGADWNIFGFSQTESTDFSPYLSLGASVFTFSPKTEYQGETIKLHPLGTEGQYLPNYPDQKPYHLIQSSLQFGGGLKFLTKTKLIIALEAMMSYTLTDYLDDASSIYISYPELLAGSGELSAALANRQGELLGTDPVILPTGTLRANKKSKDIFGVITLRLCKPFTVKSGDFKIRNHHGKTIRCPKF